MRRRQRIKFQPVVLADPYAYTPSRLLAVELKDDGTVSCVQVSMAHSVVNSWVIDEVGIGVRFIPIPEETMSVERWAKHLKSRAEVLGATPEAIRLLGTVVSLSKQEEANMAEKLKAKGGKTANKDELKSAAKAAPVGKKAATDAPKRKGNPEALAKAREARAANAGPDKRKITVLKKDHGARDGTARAAMLGKIYKAKTVQAAVDAGVKKSDVSWAAREGYIQID